MIPIVICPACNGFGIKYSKAYVGGSAGCLLCNGEGKVKSFGNDRYRRASWPYETPDGHADRADGVTDGDV